jgi:hypothetical protein
MELDILGYHPSSGALVHYEPSVDALSWEKREARYTKKFEAGRKYIFFEIFPWLSPQTPSSRLLCLFRTRRAEIKLPVAAYFLSMS